MFNDVNLKLALGLAILASTQVFAQSDKFTSAIALYVSGETEKAYPALEEIFIQPNTSSAYKLRTAAILAFAPSSYLKAHKRHFYASYCLRHPADLTEKKRSALLRIQGDGYFEESNFSSATSSYLELSKDKDLRNQAYGQYRLGWIELNQEKPASAFHRWIAFLKTRGSQLKIEDQDLLRSLIRDLGKTWAESVEGTPELTHEFSQEVNSLPLLKAFETPFAEGIALTLKRYSRETLIDTFRKQLFATAFGNPVFYQLLQRNIVFPQFPCEIGNWPTDWAGISEETRNQILGTYQACAKQVIKKNACDKPEGIAIRTLYKKLPLNGSALYPRISLAIGCTQWDLACSDLMLIAKNALESEPQTALQDQPPPDQALLNKESGRALTQVCSQAFPKKNETTAPGLKSGVRECQDGVLNPVPFPQGSHTSPLPGEASLCSMSQAVLSQLRSHLPDLVLSYVHKNLNKQQSDHPIALLTSMALQDEKVRASLLKTTLSQPSIFENSFIPKEISTQLTDAEIFESGEALLEKFFKTPLPAPALKILDTLVRKQIHDQQIPQALALLQRHLPMTPTIANHAENSAIWEYFWLSLTEKDHLILESQKPDFAVWIQSLKISQLSPKRKDLVFALALQFGKLEEVWSHWEMLWPSVRSQPQLAAAFFQKTLDLLKAQKISLPLLESTQQGKMLIRFSNHDPSLSAQLVKETLSVPLNGLSDLQAMAQMKSFSKNLQRGRLKFNSRFSRDLSYKLKIIQKEETLLSSTVWNHAEYGAHAKKILVSDCNALALELEKILAELSQKPDLKDVAEQLKEIIGQIRKKEL